MNREDLLRRIREVFPDPVWPKNKLAAIEDTGDLDCRYVIEHFQGKRWTELTREELGWTSQDAWAFNEEALAFFFPAWLTWDVGNPRDAHQVWALAPHVTSTVVLRFSVDQRMVACQAVLFVYGEEEPCDYPSFEQRLLQQLSLTMTITNTPRGPMIIGTVEEVHAHQLAEWRAMTPQDKADLFVELMRAWRPDAPGLDRTAHLVRLKGR